MSDNHLNPNDNTKIPELIVDNANSKHDKKNMNKQNMSFGSRDLRRAAASKKKGGFKSGKRTGMNQNQYSRADYLNWFNG